MNWIKKYKWLLLLIPIIITPILFLFIVGITIENVIAGIGSNSKNNNSFQATSIIQVAEKELGAPNGDKYRKWYCGSADGAAWCATFISWCADQIGILGKDKGIPKFQSCTTGVRLFKEMGIWRDGNDYKPSPGDIIFFEFNNPADGPEHVGFVWYVEDNVIHTIEGNSGDRCESNTYQLHSSVIDGYATPDYSTYTGGFGENFTENDIYYLAQLVYAEAGSSWLTDHHQQMVASVVINRINSPLYPNTLREVIAQPHQYQPYIDGSLTTMQPDQRTINNVRYVVEHGAVCPPNVLTQSGFSLTWDGVYEIIKDPLGILDDTYFCYING